LIWQLFIDDAAGVSLCRAIRYHNNGRVFNCARLKEGGANPVLHNVLARNGIQSAIMGVKTETRGHAIGSVADVEYAAGKAGESIFSMLFFLAPAAD
jgi:hypothetical protein